MRIKITFNAEKLPILYRHRFMSLIKESLENSDLDYKQFLYPEKDSELSKKVKPFTFSVSMPQEKVVKKEKFLIDKHMEIEDLVFYFPANTFIALYVSSSESQFIMRLYNGLLKLKQFDFSGDISLKLIKVYLLNEKIIHSDEVTFRTNSPILIEDSDKKPIFPDVNNPSSLISINKNFNNIHNGILKDLRGYGLYREIVFEPLLIKKQVIKHTLKGFREKTGNPYMTLTCFEGRFRLKGDRRDLQMLYQIGVGMRRGQGFGMVEVV